MTDARKAVRNAVVLSLIVLMAATLVVGISISLPEIVYAQGDIRVLLQRMDQLEQDLGVMQHYLHRNSTQEIAVSTTLDGSSNPGEEVAIRLQQRLVDIDDQLAHLTGQVEEAKFALDQLHSRVNKLATDTDYRLTEIEHRLDAGFQIERKITGTINPQLEEESKSLDSAKGRITKATTVNKKSITNNLVNREEILPSDDYNAHKELTAREQSAESAILPFNKGQQEVGQVTSFKGSIKEQYSNIVALLNQANYVAAEQAALAFLEIHPGDALAGHVQYWLGETYYARGAFRQAAAAFAKGYQKYAKSDKAPANVLKLGLSLVRLERVQDACVAFNRLVTEFPNTTNDIRQRALTEQKQLGCK